MKAKKHHVFGKLFFTTSHLYYRQFQNVIWIGTKYKKQKFSHNVFQKYFCHSSDKCMMNVISRGKIMRHEWPTVVKP